MKKALILLIMTVMIVIGIHATGTAETQEAEVLPEIAFLADEAGIVLDMNISTHFEFKIYNLELVTVVAENSMTESERFNEFLMNAIDGHQESFDLYLSDLRFQLVTREGYYADNVEIVFIGNIQTAGLILRL